MAFLSLNALSSIQKTKILPIWIYTLDSFQDWGKTLQIKIMFSDNLKEYVESISLKDFCFLLSIVSVLYLML